MRSKFTLGSFSTVAKVNIKATLGELATVNMLPLSYKQKVEMAML